MSFPARPRASAGSRSGGRLADAVDSKSGLFAHFGSKEELQVATIEMARAVFAEQVIDPALAAARGSSACTGSDAATSTVASIRAAASSGRSPPRWADAPGPGAGTSVRVLESEFPPGQGDAVFRSQGGREWILEVRAAPY